MRLLATIIILAVGATASEFLIPQDAHYVFGFVIGTVIAAINTK